MAHGQEGMGLSGRGTCLRQMRLRGPLESKAVRKHLFPEIIHITCLINTYVTYNLEQTASSCTRTKIRDAWVDIPKIHNSGARKGQKGSKTREKSESCGDFGWESDRGRATAHLITCRR